MGMSTQPVISEQQMLSLLVHLCPCGIQPQVPPAHSNCWLCIWFRASTDLQNFLTRNSFLVLWIYLFNGSIDKLLVNHSRWHSPWWEETRCQIASRHGGVFNSYHWVRKPIWIGSQLNDLQGLNPSPYHGDTVSWNFPASLCYRGSSKPIYTAQLHLSCKWKSHTNI